jgi:hypothetical protein
MFGYRCRWVVLAAAMSAGGFGCEQGAEGDRCNIDLVDSDECNSGLTCVVPSSCVIAVWCPTSPPYSDPQCECFANPNGSACRNSCSVDAAYDTGSAPAPPDAGKDAGHD